VYSQSLHTVVNQLDMRDRKMDAFKETVDAYKKRFGPLSMQMLLRPSNEIEKIAKHIMIALKRDGALTDVEIENLNIGYENSTISQAAAGDRLPEAIFETMDQNGPVRLSSDQIFANRTAVVFALPGAFTPSCHPGFVADYHKLRKLGADIVVCISVHDVFVLHEWAIATDPQGKLLFLSDNNLEFTRALGMIHDSSTSGLGSITKRYAMIVVSGIIKMMRIESNPINVEQTSSQSIIDVVSERVRPAARAHINITRAHLS